jgi:hypothetical protein
MRGNRLLYKVTSDRDYVIPWSFTPDAIKNSHAPFTECDGYAKGRGGGRIQSRDNEIRTYAGHQERMDFIKNVILAFL